MGSAPPWGCRTDIRPTWPGLEDDLGPGVFLGRPGTPVACRGRAADRLCHRRSSLRGGQLNPDQGEPGPAHGRTDEHGRLLGAKIETGGTGTLGPPPAGCKGSVAKSNWSPAYRRLDQGGRDGNRAAGCSWRIPNSAWSSPPRGPAAHSCATSLDLGCPNVSTSRSGSSRYAYA